MRTIIFLCMVCLIGQAGGQVNSRETNIRNSLRVISYQQAIQLWESRDKESFFKDREINEIAFESYVNARKIGFTKSGDLGRLMGALIRSYQGNDRDGWRARIGEFFDLTLDIVPRGFEEAMFNLILAIEFGDRESIKQQVINLIHVLI